MKKFLFSIFVLSSIFGWSQENILNANTVEQFKEAASDDIDNQTPIPYGFVAEKDRLWQRMVWETIDLDERINFPLLFPVDTLNVGVGRRSLFQVLSKAVVSGDVNAYYDGYFNQKKDNSEVHASFQAFRLLPGGTDLLGQYNLVESIGHRNYYVVYGDLLNPDAVGNYEEYSPLEVDTVFGIEGFDSYVTQNGDDYVISEEGLSVLKQNKLSYTGGNIIQGVFITDVADVYGIPQFKEQVDPINLTGSDIISYQIRGLWYFDARQGELRYRILGICPMGKDVNAPDAEEGVQLFWVYYPEVRQVLHDAKAFNSGNSARPISFDHLLNSRRFNAVITKVDNVYGDREIVDYMKDNAMMRLLESERLKEDIRNFELEMWNN